jgi:L-aspartate oxidase
VVAKAILDQPGGRALLDATHLTEEEFAREFPTVLAGARRHGFDLATERVPVTPAAHYQVGGVRTDLDGRTSVHGLYAAGEVASTGVHGANRMAGNSLARRWCSARAATAIAPSCPVGTASSAPSPTPPRPTRPSPTTSQLRRELRERMLRGAGPVRTGAGSSDLARLARP